MSGGGIFSLEKLCRRLSAAGAIVEEFGIMSIKNEVKCLEETNGLENHIYQAVEQECVIEGKLYREEELNRVNGEKAEFSKVCFKNCRFAACNFAGASFLDTVFENCDISNCDFSGSYWKGTDILRCKAQGSKFCNATWKNISINDSKFDYANFTQASWENTVIEDTSFVSSFISETRVKRLVLERNKFDSTDFFKTSLKGIDFTTCELQGILMSEDLREIKGAKLNIFQAAELAKMIGIVIE